MIKNPRLFLWIALFALAWLNYETWTRDYAAPTPTAEEAAASAEREAERASQFGTQIPDAAAPASATPASGFDGPPVVAAGDAPSSEAVPGGESAPSAATVRVRTDVLDLEISLAGGELSRADLLVYPLVKGGDEPVRLFQRPQGYGTYVLQSGLTGPAGADRPTHLSPFTAPQSEFVLRPGQDELRVPLTWTNGAGVTVTKTFVFHPGLYAIDLEYIVENDSAEPWKAASYAQLFREGTPVDRSMFNPETYAFRGPAWYDGGKYQKLDIDDKDDLALDREVQGGWLAGMQHHFVTAIVPPADVPARVTLKADGNKYLLSAIGPMRTVEPGTTAQFHETLFAGPKLQSQLDDISPELDRVADYGMLTILAKPLFIVLEWIHGIVGNWGWAIVIATFLLKLLFYPLSEAAGKSMAKMKTLAPRIKNLQETYKDDREKLGRAMMEMYQREKINPVAGCLPILIQMPVFLAYYWVLLESVEMRQAPFILWINDLSSRDPYFILPAIMAVAMFGQYKLNPAPPDPIQAKVFMFMPLVMSVMFAFFPAGLVLYWVTNTILSIAQQWNINRKIEAQVKKR